MSTVLVHKLTITGSNVKLVLDCITFNPAGIPILSGIPCEMPNHCELTESNSTAPVPKETPSSGWIQWISHNWGIEPFRDHGDGSIDVLTENEVKLWFESRTYIYTEMDEIVKRFPEFRFSLHIRFPELNVEGTTVWANGQLALFIPQYEWGPCPDPTPNAGDRAATEEQTLETAKTLIQCALDKYGRDISVEEGTAELVADAMMISGCPVTVEVESNDGGGAWLYVEIQDRPSNT